LVLGHIMARYTDASLPHIDASLTAFSLVAQWWTTRKYLANWILWIVVDVVYTAIFAYKNLYLTAGLYFFFVFLAVAGLRSWRNQLALQQSRN
jgi:nicotinamide mononucleotide transporter